MPGTAPAAWARALARHCLTRTARRTSEAFVNATYPWIADTVLGEELVTGLARSAGVPVDAFSQTLRGGVRLKRLVRPAEVAGLAIYRESWAISERRRRVRVTEGARTTAYDSRRP